jgi:ligand-binding sensor domain-containing protein
MGTNGWGCFKSRATMPPNKSRFIGQTKKRIGIMYRPSTLISGQGVAFLETVGLCLFDPRTNKISVVNNLLRSVISLEVDDAGSIWMGTENGLFQYDIASNSFIKHYIEKKGQLTMNMVVSLCR